LPVHTQDDALAVIRHLHRARTDWLRNHLAGRPGQRVTSQPQTHPIAFLRDLKGLRKKRGFAKPVGLRTGEDTQNLRRFGERVRGRFGEETGRQATGLTVEAVVCADWFQGAATTQDFGNVKPARYTEIGTHPTTNATDM